MSVTIHPTAIVDPAAQLADGVEVGAFVVIEGPVVVGEGTRIWPHAFLRAPLVLGEANDIHMGAVLGHAPQHLAHQQSRGGVRIGARNVFREYATVHRSIYHDGQTLIGDDNFFMGFSHVAHDCVVGNKVVIANHALLAGHVVVEDQAFLSGHTAVHQYVRIGRLAMIGGLARVDQDVPPFMLVKGDSEIWALNLVGLRRAEVPLAARAQLKAAFKTLYYGGHALPHALAAIEREFPHKSPELAHLLDFLMGSKRGCCGPRDRRRETHQIKANPVPMREVQEGLKAMQRGRGRAYRSVDELLGPS